MLNFWASWCDACVGETQTLERAQKVLAPTAARCSGATYQDVPSDSKAFLRKHHLTYPNVVDSDIKLATAYGTRALPETFVIDRTRPDRRDLARQVCAPGMLDRWIQRGAGGVRRAVVLDRRPRRGARAAPAHAQARAELPRCREPSTCA